MKKVLFLFFLLLFSTGNIFAQQQIKKFTAESTTFLEEIKQFFSDIDNPDQKKEAKTFIETFTIAWNTGKFSETQKQQIYITSNQMLKKKMKPIPHFKNYLSAIISFNTSGQPEKSYKAWESSLDKLINKSTSSQFINYLEVSDNLFSKNVLYESSTTKWASDNNNYTFEFDTIPKIMFSSLTLTCYANNDSACIFNTNGIYYPTLFKWLGNGGKVTWQRAGFGADTVYAEMSRYNINLKFSKFSADSVKFYNTNFFTKPLLGSLEEKVRADVTEESASYPRFISYDKRLKIAGIFPNIDYDGGFSMYGSKLMGSGDKDQDAYLIFYREGKKFVVTDAKTYIIRKDRISSDRASVSIFWEEDSIYHPGLVMKYINSSKELSMMRDNSGIAETPFFDSFHKVEMYIEAMYWKMDQPLIEMKMIKGVGTESEATFESMNFYSAQRYYKLMGIDEIHPLSRLKKYANSIKSDEVNVADYAKSLNISQSQIQSLLLQMASMGFVSYDIDDNKILIKDKLYNFLLSKAGKMDYDVIQFNSVISGKSNASLSLLNFDLKLNGVKSVFLSDSQNVYIYPKDQELILKKNRNFTFDGRVHAGLFDFYGKLYTFDYTKFNIDMPNVDSLGFYVKSFKPNEKGEYSFVRVKTVVEGIKGDLQIDASNNKSGLVPYAQYPLFNSIKDSYVYYNKSSIQKGVYVKDRFYFHVDPFEIDSLDDFSTEGIGFAGNFVSADIFPDFNEVLKVQPDYSLGFIRLTPESGYPVYGGKGTYDSIINLSNRGLRGNGDLKYLTSTSKSNDFIFFPDSMNAYVQFFKIDEVKNGVQYPTVIAEDVYEHWMPYKDLMLVKMVAKPIAMYESEAKLHGTLALSPTSLTGTGKMDFNDAEMDAKLFKFKNRVFDADTSDFKLRSYDLSQLAFTTYNYKGHIDFDARKGEFKSNGGTSKVEFPINQYICFMDEFDWFMDKDEIDLANTKSNSKELDKLSNKELADLDLSGSEFVSIHPSQDSLRFFSPRAKYNLKDNIIYAKEVKIIKVADAAIFPEKGDVTILKYAEMKPLINAQILANTTTKYHTMYNALVNIYSRKNFVASANYDYVDENGIKFPIYMGKVTVDTTLQTYGSGIISDTAKFALSSYFDFAGGVKLHASKEFLNFTGAFKINQDCDSLANRWIKFKSDIDPKDIYIPISDSIKDANNQKVFAAIALANDSNDVYTAFLSKKIKSTDLELISSSGFIYFDKVSDEYRISSKEKIKQLNQPGNYLSLTRGNCIAYGEGKLSIAPFTGRMNVSTYGNIKHYIIPDSVSLDLVMMLDFFFNDDVLKSMNENIAKYNTLTGVDLSKNTFTKTIADVLGKKEADKVISEISLNGAFKKIPTELLHTFLLSDIKMEWNPFTKSFVSNGPVGIVSINKNQINKYVKGYIEIIKKSRVGDEINIYLEFDSNDWYYFNYKTNVLVFFSSSTELNNKVKEAKQDDRTLKSEKELPQFMYQISTETKKKAFVKRMED